MRRRSQGKLRGLCLVLPALAALACGEDPAAPAGQAPATPLPEWAQHVCEHWRRDGRCDQAALIADYQECARTEGDPEMQRLLQAGVGNLALRREGERKTIVCLERRSWRMTAEGFRRLPGREKPAAPPS